MSSKKFSLFSAIIILLYAGSVLFFFGGLVVSSTRGAAVSEDYFENLTISVEQLHESEPLLSAGYISELKKLTDETPYIQAILLKKDAVPFLAYPTDSGLIKQDENHIPLISTSSPVIKMHSKTVSLGSSGTITITAAVSTITKETVWHLAGLSFIVLLITTLVVMGHIIAERIGAEKERTSVEQEQPVRAEVPEPLETSPTETVQEEAAVSEAVDTPAEEVTAGQEMVPVISETTDPMGLFCPITGFCQESYLPMRLETELARSASQEEDLAVFHVRLEGITHDNPQLKSFFEQMVQFFQFRDLMFNAGDDGYICVVPNISVDGAMNASEKLYTLLQTALTNAGITAKIVIGISTRSMRIVSASRILNEASEAVAHALEEDDMPIVAFRVNQEKYREYLEAEAQKVQDVQTLIQSAEELN